MKLSIYEEYNERLENYLEEKTKRFFKDKERELKVVQDYTEFSYRHINLYSCGQKKLLFEIIKNISEEQIVKDIEDMRDIILKYKMNRNIVVYRAVLRQHFYYNEVGDIVTPNLFLSTSLNINISKNYLKKLYDGIMLKIYVDKDTPCLYIGDSGWNGNGQELVILNNVKYKVLKKEKDTMELLAI